MEYRFVKKIFKIQTVHTLIHKKTEPNKVPRMNLILASTSPYRQKLLQRLQIPFSCLAPNVDETAQAGEAAPELVARLALAKATSVARKNPEALVIGSDQLATLGGQIMGKPGDHEAAKGQLTACSSRDVQFYTAIALVNEKKGVARVHIEPFCVRFRKLTTPQIENYLNIEKPYDCAGSFKCEGLGIALFSGLSGSDPTALEGLPLISLVTMLSDYGYDIFS